LKQLIFLLIALFLLPATAKSVDSDKGFPKETYGFFNPLTYNDNGDLKMYEAVHLTMGYNLTKTVAYEYQLGILRWVKFPGIENPRISMTSAFASAGGLVLPAYTMLIFGEKEWIYKYVMPIMLAPYGSHLAFTPADGFHMFAGVIPEIIMFSDDNGVLMRYQIGARIYHPKGLSMAIKAHYVNPVGFDQDIRPNWGIGIHVGWDLRYGWGY